MAWLTSLLKKPATSDNEHKPSAPDDAAAHEDGAQPAPAASGPPLAILAPDVGGISSFRLRFFNDAAAAATEIEQLPPEGRRGTHAFWALHDEPVVPPDGHSEALVLIRANQTSGVVYAVSFVDMESAWSFARFEAKRGLDVSHLIILWASFATVREELDGVSVLPAAPPATITQHDRTSSRQIAVKLDTAEAISNVVATPEAPTVSDAAAMPEAPTEPDPAEAEAERQVEAEAEAERQVEAEAERRAEAERQVEAEAERLAEAEHRAVAERQAEAEVAARQAEADRRAEAEETARQVEADRRAEAEEAARIARQAQDELRAARAEADAARALAKAEATRRQEAERRLEEQQTAEAEARSLALAEAQALEERSQTIEAPAQTTSYAGDEETPTDSALDDVAEPAARGTVFAHAPGAATEAETEEGAETAEIPEYLRRAENSASGGDDLPSGPNLDEFDIAYEVARLLENRRWDKREEPFQGFDSPPGRF
jgi:hypothetical protein